MCVCVPNKAPASPHKLTLIHPCTCRLATGDYADLVRELKKVLSKDSNITCAAEAASVAGALGLGLRKDFTSYAKVGGR